MRTIAIILGDNDFGNTFKPLLESLKLIIDYWKDSKEITEDDIRTVIDYSVYPFYIAYQALGKKEDRAFMENYLLGYKLLFDDAAELDIQTKDHDYGAWYLLVDSGQIGSY